MKLFESRNFFNQRNCQVIATFMVWSEGGRSEFRKLSYEFDSPLARPNGVSRGFYFCISTPYRRISSFSLTAVVLRQFTAPNCPDAVCKWHRGAKSLGYWYFSLLGISIIGLAYGKGCDVSSKQKGISVNQMLETI